MSNELKFKGTARCVWVRPNNGIIKAIYEPDPGAIGLEYMLLNLRRDRGVPELLKQYWFEIQPGFPHDVERSD